MKKTDRIARELEQSVSTGVENAKDWAAPRVEAAVNWAVPRLQHGLDSASPRIQEGLKSAAHNLAGGVATVTPRIQDGLSQLAPRINDVVDSAAPRLHGALDKAAPVIASARDRVVVDYLPRLSDQIGQASEAVHRTLEGTPARVDAVAQKLVDSGVMHNIQEQAQSAGQQLKGVADKAGKAVGGEIAKPQKPKRHRGLLIFGVIAAAAAAGVAAWKASKPIEDPWKTPAPVTPAPVPATTVTEVEDSLKETAGQAGTAAVAAADKAAKVSAEAADSAADAVDKAADKARHAAPDAADTKAASAKVATDAKTAVRNIAASLTHEADKSEVDKTEADKNGK
ncbi:hypothetical protein [Arthrobacter sp. CG_A4]|uniref:hypothetical protein n=1 Tax=Arthrobacter sp. CG_A4 TaxID=3071706 RepID=UPI002E04C969|nr:hypothetical protein [Arthrobacter sp. CG_A4]